MSDFDKMVTKAARALSDSSADACGVDRDDTWKTYSEAFIADAKSALDACCVSDLMKALQLFFEYERAMDSGEHIQGMVAYDVFHAAAHAAIAKATGKS